MSAPVVAIDPILGLDDPDYSKFENWIPHFIRPDKPCDYCSDKRLVCSMQRGEVSCTPCSTLFRQCSLHTPYTLEAMKYNNDTGTGTFLDTLHLVDEDATLEKGKFTGIKPMIPRGHVGEGATTTFRDDEPGSSKGSGIRFSRTAVKILRDWLDAHMDHPYPSQEDKIRLAAQTELKPSQIANWLANARRRRKVGEKRPKIPMSPSLKPTTPPRAIPAAKKAWEELDPFERWKASPPEHEPASITDIAQAVASCDLPEERDPTTPSGSSGRHKRSSNGSGVASIPTPSITSLGTSAQTSSHSASSAAFSRGSSRSHGSFGSFSSSLVGKQDRKRRRRPLQATVPKQLDDRKRIFQCTFCTDTFKSKYDWTRHEKSLHLSFEKWTCHAFGPVVDEKCAYCGHDNPNKDHLDAHQHHQCEEKGVDARTFYRKDHLRQHLRLMHGCEMTVEMSSWKSTAANINCRCGFCAQRFSTWQERVDHLTAHFKAGAGMTQWRGCRGLDPAVAAQVTNAMPPYLIGGESKSPIPFSATNRSSWRQAETFVEGGSPLLEDLQGREEQEMQSTCWEVLAIRLGQFANQTTKDGITLTDEMLQQHARSVLYGSDDSWNQTAADNPEWLDLFKKAHGLDFIPSTIGGEGRRVPEDLETYGDLGLRIPFAAQLHALNSNQTNALTTGYPSSYKDKLEARIKKLQTAYSVLSERGLLYDENVRCGHAECALNQVEISYFHKSTTTGLHHQRWCSQTISLDLAKHASTLRGVVDSEQTSAQQPDAAMLSNPNTLPQKPAYFQRHLYSLSPSRAHRFATTTGPWPESGAMPAAVTTTVPQSALSEYAITDIPATDLPTNSFAIPFAQTAEIDDETWQQFTDEQTMRDLDAFIATHPTAPTVPSAADDELDLSWLKPDIQMTDNAIGLEEMDIFDGVFDMPLDETFGL